MSSGQSVSWAVSCETACAWVISEALLYQYHRAILLHIHNACKPAKLSD